MTNLAPNLVIRRNPFLVAPYNLEVGWIGNAAHQAECSDHNPDAVGRVHAIDVMTLNVTLQKQVVLWCLADFADLQYVINQRTIWKRDSNGVVRAYAYTGIDPHTNHVHISGRHGSSHSVPHVTCTGYSLAAEAYVPGRFPLSLNSADLAAIKKIADEAVAANNAAAAKTNWDETIQNNVLGADGKPVGPVKARVFITSLNSQVNDLHEALPQVTS